MYDDEMNETDSRGVLTNTEVTVGDIDLMGTSFVIPLDAPLPSELDGITVPTGSLYKRLVHIDSIPEGVDFAFIPLSGGELLALERSWRALAAVKKIVVLTELPGARYDIIFDQAKRQVGLRSVDWPSVSDALATRLRERQRTTDKSPWIEQKPFRSKSRRPLGPHGSDETDVLLPPADDESEQEV